MAWQVVLNGYQRDPLLLHLEEELDQKIVFEAADESLVRKCINLCPTEHRQVATVVLHHVFEHVLRRKARLYLRPLFIRNG